MLTRWSGNVPVKSRITTSVNKRWIKTFSRTTKQSSGCLVSCHWLLVTSGWPLKLPGRSAYPNPDGRYEYNVKWVGLPYAESSWEDELLLSDFQNHIDEFLMREENPRVPIRDCRVNCFDFKSQLSSNIKLTNRRYDIDQLLLRWFVNLIGWAASYSFAITNLKVSTGCRVPGASKSRGCYANVCC